MELGELQDRLRSAERKSLSTARTAADPDVWSLVRLSADLRELIDDAAIAGDRDEKAGAGA
jgi:hypothetical protein